MKDKALRRLRDLLLQKDPEKRPESWPDVIAILQEKDGGHVETLLDQLGDKADRNLGAIQKVDDKVDRNLGAVQKVASDVQSLSRQLENSVAHLSRELVHESAATRQLMLDMANVEVPYMFEIVAADESIAERADAEVREHAVALKADAVADAVAETDEQLEERAQKLIDARVGRARRLFRKVKAAVNDPVQAVADCIKRMSNRKVELRLLCGITLEPAVSYTIELVDEDVVELATQASRMIGIGLKIAAGWNAVAGTARCFGVPVPKISESAANGGKDVQAFLGELRQHDEDLARVRPHEAAGMDLEQLQAFAVYLARLEATRSFGTPGWKQKLFRVGDRVVPGRPTWAAASECGVYGGDVRKAKTRPDWLIGIGALFDGAAMPGLSAADVAAEGAAAVLKAGATAATAMHAKVRQLATVKSEIIQKDNAASATATKPTLPWLPTGPGRLTIAVIKCEGIPMHPLNATTAPTPYVSIRLQHKLFGTVVKAKTATKKGTRNPVYDGSGREQLVFEIKGGLANYKCDIVVKHEKRFMSYHLAHCKPAVSVVPEAETAFDYGPRPAGPVQVPIGEIQKYSLVSATDDVADGGHVYLQVVSFAARMSSIFSGLRWSGQTRRG